MTIVRSIMEEVSSTAMPSLHGSSTGTGVTVTPEKALQIPAVYACATIIATSIAGLPVDIFRKEKSRRIELPSHWAAELLNGQPNPDMTSVDFWTQIIAWVVLRGNSFGRPVYGGNGLPKQLWPVPPTRVEPWRGTRGELKGRLGYRVTLQDDDYVPGMEAGKPEVVLAPQMMHFKAFGFGVMGLSPIALARQGLGIMFAAEQYGARFFANDATPGGMLVAEGELSGPSFDRLEAQFTDRHQGFQNAHQPMVGDHNLKWVSVGLPPEDAQFLETRKFGVEEVARMLGVPPFLIADNEKISSWGTGVAEQGINFVRYTLSRYITAAEAVIKGMLGPNEFAKFNVSALQRGDMKARYDAYAVAREWGWQSANDIRALEDQAPIENGDIYLQPMNFQAASKVVRTDRTSAPLAIASGLVREHQVEAHARALRELDEGADLAPILRALGDATLVDAIESMGADVDVAELAGWSDRNAALEARQMLAGWADLDIQARAAARVLTLWSVGTDAAARSLGRTEKSWRSRDCGIHSEMDGELVEIDARFSNGARFPGDWDLSTEERESCTCDVVFT